MKYNSKCSFEVLATPQYFLIIAGNSDTIDESSSLLQLKSMAILW